MRSMYTGFVVLTLLNVSARSWAADWPQWRGLNRDAKATGFVAPAAWPAQLAEKWGVAIGDGVATPALVGDRLYTFSRQDNNEVIHCLDAATGNEIWQYKYEAQGADGPASGFAGPRCSPTVADGRVVTLGVRGMLTCLDAGSGAMLWQKEDFAGSWPRFYTSSSPIVVDGLAIAQLGGGETGGIVAYDLGTGEKKWEWSEDGPAYASPVVAEIGGTKVVITVTERNRVALGVADGKVLWQEEYSQGRYNAASPIVDGATLIHAAPSRGVQALKLASEGEKLSTEEVWSNDDSSLMFNSPVLKDGYLYGLSNTDSLFCINTTNGQTVWNAPLLPAEAQAAQAPPPPPQQPPAEGGRRRGRGGRGGGRSGYGSIVDAGAALFALSPKGQLVVFAPGEAFQQLASYKVAEADTYAYPLISDNRIYIKDKDSLTLWTID